MGRQSQTHILLLPQYEYDKPSVQELTFSPELLIYASKSLITFKESIGCDIPKFSIIFASSKNSA